MLAIKLEFPRYEGLHPFANFHRINGLLIRKWLGLARWIYHYYSNKRGHDFDILFRWKSSKTGRKISISAQNDFRRYSPRGLILPPVCVIPWLRRFRRSGSISRDISFPPQTRTFPEVCGNKSLTPSNATTAPRRNFLHIAIASVFAFLETFGFHFP